MDEQAFHNYLQSLHLAEDEIQASIAIAQRFEDFLAERPGARTAETAWDFSRLLINKGGNTEANYVALFRYCRIIRDDEMFIAILELVDGGEVGQNLYRMVGERFGSVFRDEVFAGLGVAPYGTPSPEKPAYLQPVIERLRVRLGDEACADLLSVSLRDLPDEDYLPEREKFKQAGSVDAYLIRRKADFVARLEACQREGRLFFMQEITDEVLDFVRGDPEIGGGRRVGNIIYGAKIPYLTRQYLAETDPVLKRYYACHCPWARDAIKNGGVQLSATFCNCSGGFHKKPWEVIFGRRLRVDVLESALKGDMRCRFAIHLPEEAVVPAPRGALYEGLRQG